MHATATFDDPHQRADPPTDLTMKPQRPGSNAGRDEWRDDLLGPASSNRLSVLDLA